MPNYKLFLEDPHSYLLAIWKEGKDNYDQIKPRLDENWELWNLRSRALEDRANEDDGRSVLFIPVINTACDARNATITAEVLNNTEALKFKPLPGSETEEEDKKVAEKWNALIDSALDIDNNFESKLIEYELSGEIYPIIFLKVYVDDLKKEKEGLEKSPFDVVGLPEAEETEEQETETEDEQTYYGPMFDVLPPHEILYDFSVKNIQDSPYVIHWKKVDYFYLKSKWPDKIKDDIIEKQTTDTTYTDYAQEQEEGAGRGETQKKRQTYDLCEAWIKTITPKGKIRFKIYWFMPEIPHSDDEGNNRKLFVLDESWAKDLLMTNVDYPFVPYICRIRPGKLEGMSTADLLVSFQHEESDTHNMAMDSINYRIFPPITQLQDSVISPKTPRLSPGEMITVNQKDALGTLPFGREVALNDLLQMRRLNQESIQNVAANFDTMMGSDYIKSEQTLGEVRIKNQGAGRRIGISILLFYKALRELKIKYMQIFKNIIASTSEEELAQMHPLLKSFSKEELNAKVDIFIPNLPQLADKATRQVLADRHLERLTKVPIVSSNPRALLEVVKFYLDAYEYPPDRKEKLLEEIEREMLRQDVMPLLLDLLTKAGIPLPPQLVQALTGQGQNGGQAQVSPNQPTQMPQTAETFTAGAVG